MNCEFIFYRTLIIAMVYYKGNRVVDDYAVIRQTVKSIFQCLYCFIMVKLTAQLPIPRFGISEGRYLHTYLSIGTETIIYI